jgi:hypothetical protein
MTDGSEDRENVKAARRGDLIHCRVGNVVRIRFAPLPPELTSSAVCFA